MSLMLRSCRAERPLCRTPARPCGGGDCCWEEEAPLAPAAAAVDRPSSAASCRSMPRVVRMPAACRPALPPARPAPAKLCHASPPSLRECGQRAMLVRRITARNAPMQDHYNHRSRHHPSSSLQPPMPHRAAACPASPNRSGSTLSTMGGAAASLARQMRQVPSNEADSRASGSQGWKSTKAVGPACPTSTDTGRPGRPSLPCWAEMEGAFWGRVVKGCCGGSTGSAPACRRPDL